MGHYYRSLDLTLSSMGGRSSGPASFSRVIANRKHTPKSLDFCTCNYVTLKEKEIEPNWLTQCRMTAISKSPLRTFPLYYKQILYRYQYFQRFLQEFKSWFLSHLKISIQFFIQLPILMTSSDGMMLKMTRHVYVCLQLAGPEDPRMPLSCAGSQWEIGLSRQKSRQMIRKGRGKSMWLTVHKLGLHTGDRLL